LKSWEAAVLASILGTTGETLLQGDASLLFLSGKLTAVHEKIASLEGELDAAIAEVAGIEERLQLAKNEREAIYLEGRGTQDCGIPDAYPDPSESLP
jgi:hypothetical protein